jgi:hypothetical protein
MIGVAQRKVLSLSTMTSTTGPPFYILLSHSTVRDDETPSSTSLKTLGHPIIQYHYADDSPLALVPQNPDEHVLVLDYDPSSTPSNVPTVKSISRTMAVTGVKVSEAPGAAAAHEELKIKRNDKMYILETWSTTEYKYVALRICCCRGVETKLGLMIELARKLRKRTFRILRWHFAGLNRGSSRRLPSLRNTY